MAYHSFGGEVEATIRHFTHSRRHQLWRIILVSARILDRGFVLFFYFARGSNLAKMPVHKLLYVRHTTSSAKGTQLYSNNCMFFSIRRYSGMLIFQGRV